MCVNTVTDGLEVFLIFRIQFPDFFSEGKRILSDLSDCEQAKFKL